MWPTDLPFTPDPCRFGQDFIHEAMEGGGESVRFVFGLTYEVRGTVALNRKFRCLIIRQGMRPLPPALY